MLAGVIFSPPAANFIRPLDYALGSHENLETISLYFCRLVLGIQLVLTGVDLPKRYLQTEWKSLSLLLGLGMPAMWIISSLLVWAMIPHFSFLHAIIVAACVTPTDPVLSSSIVQGKFANTYVPVPLQRLILAEAGANDGLGYPFLFIGLYLLKYIGVDNAESGNGAVAFAKWVYDTVCYVVLMSVAYGAVAGWLGRKLLHWAEEKRFVDRENFLVYAIALAVCYLYRQFVAIALI